MVAERKAKIILFTDQWRSPVSKFADFTAWDSSVATMLLIEALIAAVQDRNRAESKRRMESLEEMFDKTSFFRKLT